MIKCISTICMWLAFVSLSAQQTQTTHTYLTGKVKTIRNLFRDNCDTIILEIFEKNHLTNNSISYREPQKYYLKMKRGAAANGNSLSHSTFQFDIPDLKGPSYISLRLPVGLKGPGSEEPALLDKFIIESGDSVFIDFGIIEPVYRLAASKRFYVAGLEIDRAIFSGRGAAKYDFLFKLRIPYAGVNWDKVYLPDSIRNFRFNSSTQLSLLEKYKDQISSIGYQMLKADVIFNPTTSEKFGREGISDSALFLSRFYARYVIYDTLSDFKNTEKYNMIKCSYQGPLRDKMLALFFLYKYAYLPKQTSDSLMEDALQIVRFKPYVDYLVDMRAQLKPGSTAYNFSLPDVKGKMVRLEDFKGKTVFIDFWYTGCAPCAGFYQKRLSKVEKYFENDPSVVFVTVALDDNNNGSWVASVNTGQYTSPSSHNVINLHTESLGKNHPVIRHYNVYGYPRPLIIDKYGNVFRSSDLILDENRLIEIMEEAKSVSSN